MGLRWGGATATACGFVLCRRRGRRDELRRRQPPLVAARGIELLDPFRGIFLERQSAIVIEVELVEVPAPGGEIFVGFDLPVLILVVTAEALLFARLGARFGRLERRLRAEQ